MDARRTIGSGVLEMKISWHGNDYGMTGLHAEPGEYDASLPVDSLLIDYAPRNINPERLAVAAYLAFGRWVSGDLQLPAKLGPATAAAIERDLKHVHVRPGPIEYYPKPLEIGTREIRLNFTEAKTDPFTQDSMTILPSSGWNGGLRGLRSMTIASNAFALDSDTSHPQESIRARLAVGVLFAGDLSADRFVVQTPELITDSEISRLTDLLLSVRLGLSFQ